MLMMFTITGWILAAIFIVGAYKASKQQELQEGLDADRIDRMHDYIEEQERSIKRQAKQVKLLQSKIRSASAITPYAMNVKHAKQLVN